MPVRAMLALATLAPVPPGRAAAPVARARQGAAGLRHGHYLVLRGLGRPEDARGAH